MDNIKKFVICTNNEGYEASLERWKLYPVLDESNGMLLVIDESGEEYLYEKNYFDDINLPLKIEERYSKEIVQ